MDTLTIILFATQLILVVSLSLSYIAANKKLKEVQRKYQLKIYQERSSELRYQRTKKHTQVHLVHNKERKMGADPFYFYIEPEFEEAYKAYKLLPKEIKMTGRTFDSGYVDLLFTASEIERAKARAKENKEDFSHLK